MIKYLILSLNELKKTLAYSACIKVDFVNDINEYSILGENVVIWFGQLENPVKIIFFGDDIESISFLKDQSAEKRKNYEKIFQSNIDKRLEVFFETWEEYFINLIYSIKLHDYIVHENHGVAVFAGVKFIENIAYLVLEYAQEDKIYLPFNQISKLSKYIGVTGVQPKITRLNSGEWNRITNKVKEDVIKTAKELLHIFALRKLAKPPEITGYTKQFDQFCDNFKFKLTDDQTKAVIDIQNDLFDNKKPMNRLVIGDVGFGKTEVALRTAFIVLENGYKVMLICPTTLLAIQHYELIKSRFEEFGFKIALLTSLNSSKNNQNIKKGISDNKYDFIIGTHSLLSDSFNFKELGLVIIDEEQKFGVKQKEKLKSKRHGVHVLSMSATPIPRTLSLTLSKLQDISVILTPPLHRKPIKTILNYLDYELIKSAIEHELKRNGQVYFIHNNIKTINTIKNKLTGLVNANISIIYSKSNSNKTSLNDSFHIEKTLKDFYERKSDILISTTIIENGIDMPNVNTIIINQAQNFGLSQLHQLRGRVGRSDKQAYCYIFYDNKVESLETKNKSNKKFISRLETIEKFQELGSGFSIANEDLSLRGGGNILGREQSGNINSIGYTMYLRLLEDEIDNLATQVNSRFI